jgi:hypothetical protein
VRPLRTRLSSSISAACRCDAGPVSSEGFSTSGILGKAHKRRRFCMASNKVLKVALGKSETDEQQEGVHRLSERVHGNVGLFFTQLPRGEVEQLFGTFQVPAAPLTCCRSDVPSWGGQAHGRLRICLPIGYRFFAVQAVDFARPGCRATEDFVLEEGPLEGPLGARTCCLPTTGLLKVGTHLAFGHP